MVMPDRSGFLDRWSGSHRLRRAEGTKKTFSFSWNGLGNQIVLAGWDQLVRVRDLVSDKTQFLEGHDRSGNALRTRPSGIKMAPNTAHPRLCRSF